MLVFVINCPLLSPLGTVRNGRFSGALVAFDSQKKKDAYKRENSTSLLCKIYQFNIILAKERNTHTHTQIISQCEEQEKETNIQFYIQISATGVRTRDVVR